MIDSLIQWSLKNRIAVLLVSTILLVAGGVTASRMPVDVFPDLTAPTVTVITEAHGMAPVEVETQVTVPVESALNGAAGVRRVRSSTAVGISVVWVEFEWGTDINAARQVVSERLDLVANELPPEVQRPILAPTSSIMGEILFLSLSSRQHTPMEVRTVADTVIRRRLLAVPGVSQVTPLGGDIKQFQVIVSPEQLLARNITLGQLIEALPAANKNISAGFYSEQGSEVLVSGVGRFRTLEEIGQTVLSVSNNIPTTVADVGVVRIGSAPKRGEGSANGRPAVIMGIQKQPQVNTLELTRELDAVLEEIAAELPAGMELNQNIFRQANFISVAISNVTHALRDGAILVVVIVLLFLGNVRATFITVTAIPLSLVAAVLILKALGITINTMSLGGMAIAIGALVDDAVIDVENVFRRLRENAALPESQRRPSFSVVYEASAEIRSSIFFATLIIVLVFLPLFFLSGVEGRLLQPLGVAYVVSLLASLLVAVTVTPVLCYFLLPGSKAVRRGTEPRLVHILKSRYAPILRRVLPHPWLSTAFSVALLVIAVATIPFFGKSFLPEFNEGSLTISAVTIPGTSLEESDKIGRVLEKTLLTFEEVVSVARRTGRAELDEHAQGVESSELDVSLAMKERSKAEFLAALREELSMVAGANITIGQPISHRIDHMLSGTRANIAVKIFGEHLSGLRSVADEIEEAMSEIEGVVDLSIEQQAEVPMLTVRYDRPSMSRFGLSVEDVARYLEAAVQGVQVSRILEGRVGFDLVVRLAGEATNADRFKRIMIQAPSGAIVPLESVAEVRKETTPNVISRERVERKIVVMCNVAGRDVSSVVEEIRERVAPVIEKRPGHRVEYSGQFESAIQARRTLAILAVVVLLGIGLLLSAAFNSSRDAVLVMLNLPLALIGGVAGVFLSGGVLSVASLIGFITVFGIATRNGIMLVSHIRHLQAHEGVTDFTEAVYRGSMERLAPILMTALATALALIPLALGGEKPGNEIQTPMAIVILFGLLSSMVMNMIVVPALYLRFGTRINPQPSNQR